MLDYHKLEEEVFNILYRRHLLDEAFTFSVRKKVSNKTSYDYFIGTYDSRYFAFTLWENDVRYSGASIDLLAYVIKINQWSFHFFFQYYISKKAIGKQNNLNMLFYKYLKDEFRNYAKMKIGKQKEGLKLSIYPLYTIQESKLLQSFLSFIDDTSVRVNNAIHRFKVKYPEWKMERIKPDSFSHQIKALQKRLWIDLDSFYSLTNSQEEKEIKKITALDIPETEKKALIKSRLGQGKFRDSLLAQWKCCCISKIKNPDLLRASHIKPWRISSNKERLDPYNGLLLLPNYDLLFDKYLITFEDSGRIRISPKLSNADMKILGISKEIIISLKEENKKYLKYHREQFNILNN